MSGEEWKDKIIFWTELDETEEVAGMTRAVAFAESGKISGKLAELSSDEVKEKIRNIIENFGNNLLMKKDSNYYVDEIEISISVTAQGNIIVVGGSMTGGIKIIIKPKKI